MDATIASLVDIISKQAETIRVLTEALGGHRSPEEPTPVLGVQPAPERHSRASRRGARAVPCDYCKSAVGEPCTTGSGGRANKSHKVRRRAVYGRRRTG
ncbi:hypothetical protein [Streptomyces sp. NPDC047043]|uniref:zinc finger domain-containing protein n=1 Tax=Streptomyces sp. NPDC047043 TaxID=3154497 RepID=UPI0033DC0357